MIDFFEESAERVPDQDAIRYFDEAISYSELDDLAERFATLLASRGVQLEVAPTPFGTFGGALSPLPAPELGDAAIGRRITGYNVFV